MSKIYAISDLHLGFYRNKTMDKFGPNWENHHEKIKKNWQTTVESSDYVFISGDISWAMKLKEAIKDLDFINELPGNKIFIKGNHDYWWDKTSKLNLLYDNMIFLQNGCYELGDIAVCGTRGWFCPGDAEFGEHDKKIYLRELGRLETGLEAASQNGQKIIVMIHFPVFNEKNEPSGFVDLIRKYCVQKVIFGHLHGKSAAVRHNGVKDGIEYIQTSADYLDFKPLLINIS